MFCDKTRMAASESLKHKILQVGSHTGVVQYMGEIPPKRLSCTSIDHMENACMCVYNYLNMEGSGHLIAALCLHCFNFSAVKGMEGQVLNFVILLQEK